MISDAVRTAFYARLRTPPSRSSVPGSLPVLFFGDLFRADVVTVGLNPSDREYLGRDGRLLTGAEQRLSTLDSVRVRDRSGLTDEDCDDAIRWMRNYYDPGRPVYGSWFASVSRVLSGFGVDFRSRRAAHLDLVQEATRPTWSVLRSRDKAEHDALLKQDLPFLLWQLRTFPLRAIICTSSTVGIHVRAGLGAEVTEEGPLGRATWWLGQAEIEGRSISLAGWNIPLARATGLDRDDQVELGKILSARLDRRR